MRDLLKIDRGSYTTLEFVYINAKVKPSNETWLLPKSLLNFLVRQLMSVLLLVPVLLALVQTVLESVTMLVLFYFAMEDFNRKGLKEFHEPLTCIYIKTF